MDLLASRSIGINQQPKRTWSKANFKACFSTLLNQNQSYICLSFDCATIFLHTSQWTPTADISLTCAQSSPLRLCNGSITFKATTEKNSQHVDVSFHRWRTVRLIRPKSLSEIVQCVQAKKEFFLPDQVLTIIISSLRNSRTYGSYQDLSFLFSDVYQLYVAESLGLTRLNEAPNSQSNHSLLTSMYMASKHYKPEVKKNEETPWSCKRCDRQFQFYSLKWLHYHSSAHAKCAEGLRDIYLRANGPSGTADCLDNMIAWETDLSAIRSVFNCKTCIATFKSLNDYSLHVESHPSSFLALFPCPHCCKIYRNVSNFVTHNCLRPYQPQKKEQNLDLRCRPSFYPSVPNVAATQMCTCRNCGSKFDFVSELMVHYMSNVSCSRVVGGNVTDANYVLMNTSQFPGQFTCELCGIVLPSVFGYLLHLDHHQLSLSEKNEPLYLSCKRCNEHFRTPCSFYNHLCKKKIVRRYCFFCDEIERSCQQIDLRIVSVKSLNLALNPAPPTTMAPVTTMQQPRDEIEANVVDLRHDEDVQQPSCSNKKKPVPKPISSNKKPKEYLDYNYYCDDCGVIIPSDELWKHFRSQPRCVETVKPLIEFNQFKVNVL